MKISIAGHSCEVIEDLPGPYCEVRNETGHLAVADTEQQQLHPLSDFGGPDRLVETCAMKAAHCDS